MSTRTLQQILRAHPTSDGAGVKLRRSLGQSPGARLDPFLMLDEFSTDNPDDYIAGFPAHPHRGFETVTYMLEGHMQHEDHLGHRGELVGGGAQWMTAGRGIIHSEMPLQENGRMHGFQLWINLPAREKLKPAAYRDVRPEEIASVALEGGGHARVIAGRIDSQTVSVEGPIQGLSTAPLFADVKLPAGACFTQAIEATHNAFVYVYEGELEVGATGNQRRLAAHEAGLLSTGACIAVAAGALGARFILLAARPLREPVVQYGPFVMNTREEIEQAIVDYQNGELTKEHSASLLSSRS
ncbi:MAG: pirin family protein [Gammaproteobacteria bacterium]|nr:pirin family protein [Gammaproteobacteria bacterium]MCP5197856.1 pirin family protein [Gammaproteobacteria bacterium]